MCHVVQVGNNALFEILDALSTFLSGSEFALQEWLPLGTAMPRPKPRLFVGQHPPSNLVVGLSGEGIPDSSGPNPQIQWTLAKNPKCLRIQAGNFWLFLADPHLEPKTSDPPPPKASQSPWEGGGLRHLMQ